MRAGGFLISEHDNQSAKMQLRVSQFFYGKSRDIFSGETGKWFRSCRLHLSLLVAPVEDKCVHSVCGIRRFGEFRFHSRYSFTPRKSSSRKETTNLKPGNRARPEIQTPFSSRGQVRQAEREVRLQQRKGLRRARKQLDPDLHSRHDRRHAHEPALGPLGLQFQLSTGLRKQ